MISNRRDSCYRTLSRRIRNTPQDGSQLRHLKVSPLFLYMGDVLMVVHAKKMVQARKIIAEGCEKCPTSEDVWFHAAELNVSETLGSWLMVDT